MQSTHTHTKAPVHKHGYLIRLGLVVLLAIVAGGLGAAGCLNRPLCSVKQSRNAAGQIELVEDCRPRTTNLFVDTIQNRSVDKIDLLFAIDNSSSMADKQQVLAEAVPALVTRLVNPVCVDDQGNRGQTPADPLADCPDPFSREFKPIGNIHIGIITSSLGAHGAPGPNGLPHLCESGQPPVPDGNDHAHLLGALPRGQGTGYPNPGDPFLNWNPSQNAGDINQLNNRFQAMVRAAGQVGCGFEVQFESMYRFLMDPFPPQAIVAQGSPPRATPQGIDQNIISQRAAFLRPDSLVAVIMLTDENDCSIRDSDQFYYAAVIEGLLPQPATVCATNPNDPCCYSCGLPPPTGCAPDPKCTNPPPSHTQQTDAANLRCFDQKRRFGIDFLYPVQRYVNALKNTVLCTTTPDLAPNQQCPRRADNSPGQVPNPLYQDLTNQGGGPRDPSLVFFAAITGVPWQLISDPARSNPPNLVFYKTGEITALNLWGALMGDPNASPPSVPGDPHMQESVDPRPGLPGPNTPATADPIHGHEYVVNPTRRDDLQYACIFDKPTPTPCTDNSCDCFDRQPGDNNPLCADAAGNYGTTQYKAKAYPCLREMQLLKDFGANAIMASLCPRQLNNPSAQDYGYNPAVDAIIERLKEALTTKCLPRKLEVASDGTVPCSIIEATTNAADAVCDPARARRPAANNLIEPARARLAADGVCDAVPNNATPDCNTFKFCEMLKADDSCLTMNPQTIGWCYVEPGAGIGDPQLTAKCPANQPQILNFVGENTPARGSTVLIACLGAPVGAAGGAAPAPTGAPPPGPPDGAVMP
jgi:hypothetical protein